MATGNPLRILDKYFLKEFCRPLFLCGGAFLLCWLVYDLLDNLNDFMDAGEWLGVVKYYLIILPAWLVQVMPITLLLSLLYTLADLSKSGELIAMRATGQDLYRLMIPVFVIAGVVTAVMMVLNVSWAPHARLLAKGQKEHLTKEESLAAGIGQDIFYKSLTSHRSWYIEQLDFDNNEASTVDRVESDDQGRDLFKYVATKGVFQNGHWTLYDVLLYDLQKKETEAESTRRLLTVDLPDCRDEPERFQMKQKAPKYMSSRELSLALQLDKTMPKSRRAQYLTELYSRFAFPFSNLIVILIGMPFGITPHRRSAFLAVTNALLIFAAYQIISYLLLPLGNNNVIPPLLAAWLPNIVFGALGVYLIRGIR
jgi:lipopolysaccharide export system permease protein